MRKHSENSSNQIMSSSHDSLSERQAVLFSFKEIVFKGGIATDNVYGHKIDNSSEMTITFFRGHALKLAGLIDSGVNPCKSDKGLMGGEVIDITYFSEGSSVCGISDTVYGSNDFHLLNSNGLTEFRQDVCDFIQLLHQIKKQRNLLGEKEFLCKAIGGDGAFGGSDNIISTLSVFATSVNSFCNNLRLSGSDETSRGEFFKGQEHCSGEDITDGFEFREGGLQIPLNLVFIRSDEITDGFPFYGNISEVFRVLRDGKLLDGILVNEDELGDSERFFFVSFRLTQRHLSEIRDQKWINDNSIDLFRTEKRKEIDMVETCGLHSSKDSREVFTFGTNSPHEFRETAPIHICRQGKPDINFSINASGRKRILGYINTDKKMTQSDTSVEICLNKAGEASRPILHDDKDSMNQSTYYGYGRQGTDSSKGSSTQEKRVLLPVQTLTGKTHLYNLYKSYNTNS